MKSKDILLLINPTATDSVYPTLIQYAKEHAWRLTIEDRMAPPAGWRGDGAIIQAMDWPVPSRYAKQLVRRGIPTVNITNSRTGKGLSSCVTDDGRCGRMAAEYYRGLGFTHTAFFAMEWIYKWQVIAEGFLHGKNELAGELWAWPLETSATRLNNRLAMARWLKDKLLNAPKPLAVLCPNSYNSVTLLNVCRDAGIAVPDEVAIMSAHYDAVFCDCQDVPISGIELDTARQAKEAAHMLDGLIDGSLKGPVWKTLPPTRIIAQLSTDVQATDDPLLRRAFRFIRENLSRPFGAAETAEHLGIPRIRLDRLFAAKMKRSVGAEIRRQRIARAKKLLSETDDTLNAIAAACGFCHASYLVNAFKKETGSTPHCYRKAVAARSRDARPRPSSSTSSPASCRW